MKDIITLHFDGACEPFNPGGVAGCGFIIKDSNGKILKKGSKIIGSGKGMTNNIAEYNGLLEGVKSFLELKISKKIMIYGDNEIVCRTISKEWGWNKKKTQWIPHKKYPELQKLAEKTSELLNGVDYEINWIPRDNNQEADMLSKELLTDEILKKAENNRKKYSDEMLKKAENNRKKCSECDGYLIKRKGPYGEFYGCSNFPECRYKEPLRKDRKDGNVKNIKRKKIKVNHKEGDVCPKSCGGILCLKMPKVTQKKLKRNYYYKKYLQCDKCKTIYFEDKYKVTN